MKRVSALILALMFLFLASCGTDAAPETTTEQANSASTDLKIDYEIVKVPFKSVSSPLLLDGKLVMAVATADRTETDRRYLISYDIGSGKYDNIFESTHELGDIQSIRFDGEWLIWNDCEIYNSARNIYCTNYKTKEITQITKLGNDSAVGEPCISDGVVFWDECFDIGGENTRSLIKAYDCTTKETKTISEGGDKVCAGDGKAVFTVNKGGKTTLGVYDIASGKVTEFALGDGSYTLKDCAAGYALYVETKDPSRGDSSQKHGSSTLATAKPPWRISSLTGRNCSTIMPFRAPQRRFGSIRETAERSALSTDCATQMLPTHLLPGTTRSSALSKMSARVPPRAWLMRPKCIYSISIN